MGSIFLPPRVARELLDERQQFTQCLLKACSTDAVCVEWNTELQRLDPRLRMVKAPEHLVIGMPLRPGHYHLIRDNQDAPPSVTPVTGPNGEFRVPDSGLLEKLRATDLWNARVIAQHGFERARRDAAAEKDRVRLREDRQQQLHDVLAANTRTQVSMNRDHPWSQNHAGERAAKAAARGRSKAA